jgi:hypothetical protein
MENIKDKDREREIELAIAYIVNDMAKAVSMGSKSNNNYACSVASPIGHNGPDESHFVKKMA